LEQLEILNFKIAKVVIETVANGLKDIDREKAAQVGTVESAKRAITT
jgi:hypothetical protein